MLLMNEQFVEKRAASTVASTADVLPGTLMNVPSALPTGPIPNAPVVAVNVISRWKSKVNILSVAVLPVQIGSSAGDADERPLGASYWANPERAGSGRERHLALEEQGQHPFGRRAPGPDVALYMAHVGDRKSTRLNSSHLGISY